MASGDLFKRKGLLPFKGGGSGNTPVPPPGVAAGSKTAGHDTTEADNDNDDDADDVFMRPTIVPDFASIPNGALSGPPSAPPNAMDRNVTARPPRHAQPTEEPSAPNVNTFATIPAAANPRPPADATRSRARDITPLEGPPAGVHSWTSPHRAMNPPAQSIDPAPYSGAFANARGGAANSRGAQPDALDRRTPVVPSSHPDFWGPTSGRESGGNALGFVDALPRLTTRPPERDPAHPRRSEDGDRPSVVSLSELIALNDYSGALHMAELRLAANPGDTEAQRYAQDCRRVLIKMQISRLGSLQQVAELAIDRDELQWLSLDHRAGFILSLVDGQLSIDDLLDICGMPRLDALQIVAELVEKKVLNLRSANS